MAVADNLPSVELYTALDSYVSDIDNRPLEDLSQRDTYLAGQIDLTRGRRVVSLPGVAYVLTSADFNAYVRATAAGASSLIVPLDAVGSIPVGAEIVIRQLGAGTITLSGEVGVTLNHTSSTLTSSGVGAKIYLVRVDSASWDVFGDLS